MQQIHRLLILSAQAQQLQNIVRTAITPDLLIIDVLNGDGSTLPERLRQATYSVLLIDLAILSKSKALLPDITRQHPSLAILLLATPDQRQHAGAYLAQGVVDYFLQPVVDIELIIKLERVMNLHPTFTLESRLETQEASSRSELDEMVLLNEAVQEIMQTLPLDRALATVLAKVHEIVPATITKIWLTGPSGELVVTSSLSHPLSVESRPDIEALLFGLAQKAARHQQTIVENRIGTKTGEWPLNPLTAVLLIPLISRLKLIGVLALASEHPQIQDPNQIHRLTIFCAQAAIVLENAQLFQNLSSAYVDLAQSREEILHSRNTLSVVFDGITDGLYILDKDLTISALNQVEAEHQGLQRDDLIGKSFLSLEWAKSAPQLLGVINESLQHGKQTTWISPLEENRPHLKDRGFRIYPIRNRMAQIEQVVIFAQDISEQRRWQASLFRSANLAAVGQLAGSMAHQINNPLTVTMTNSQLLLLDLEPSGEMHDLANGIFHAGERIQKIVTNLLEFSNQERYFFTRTNLIETIEDALALGIRSLRKSQVTLVKDYQVQPMLSASVSHLKLVWVNLLLNARDAVVEFAPKPEIVISTQAVSDRTVKVAFTDNGVGLTDTQMEQLFRPFFTTKPVGKALGLGLYSAHAIIERHQGQIRAFSTPGVATTFEVTLPLDLPQDL